MKTETQKEVGTYCEVCGGVVTIGQCAHGIRAQAAAFTPKDCALKVLILTPEEHQRRRQAMTTGYCAANYTKTDTYDADECGPIRRSSEMAQKDADKGEYDGVRYVHTDGYLYVDKPE